MSARSRILSCFKKLHQTRKTIFAEDERALIAARQKINSEFRKNSEVTDAEKIEELIKLGEDSEEILRISVVQGRKTDRGTIEVRVTKDTMMEDNFPFDSNAVIPSRRKRGKCEDVPS
ncbi:hypothetical protein ScPMuIL_011358 [Solemya velum]